MGQMVKELPCRRMYRTDLPNLPSLPGVLQICHHHSIKTQMPTMWCYFKRLNINDKGNKSEDAAEIYKKIFAYYFLFFF